MNVGGEGWFVADAEGNARGPFTQAQLQAERDAGRVRDEHLVWTLRLSEWVPLKRAFGGQTAAEKAATPAQPQPAPANPVATKMPRPQPKASQPKAAQPRPAQSKATQPKAPLPGTSPVRSSDDWRGSAGKAAPGKLPASLLIGDDGRELARSRDRAGEAVRRWLARQIDTLLLGGLGWALLAAIGWKTGMWSLGSPSDELASAPLVALVVLVLGAVPLEALLVGLTGLTPGRALLGLRVSNMHGAAPGLRLASERAVRVALYGQALLLFPFAIFAYAIAGGSLVKNGRTHWDQALGLRVGSSAVSARQWLTTPVAILLAWAMFIEDGWMRLVGNLLSL